MPSPTHALFLEAMRKKRPVSCVYQGHKREICPRNARPHEPRGEGAGLPVRRVDQRGADRKPDWKCFKLAEVRDAHLIDGRWHAGTEHSEAQTCMKMVEYDVNPASPYNPAFRL